MPCSPRTCCGHAGEYRRQPGRSRNAALPRWLTVEHMNPHDLGVCRVAREGFYSVEALITHATSEISSSLVFRDPYRRGGKTYLLGQNFRAEALRRDPWLVVMTRTVQGDIW